MSLPFELPPPMHSKSRPEWTGSGFRLGDRVVPVLEYSENFEGWSDDLTTLHEEAVGASHTLDVASRADALAQLKAHPGIGSATILEIGCSSGYMLQDMRTAFPKATIVGADVVKEPLYRLARELKSQPLIRFDLLQCPLPEQIADAVVMLNVLEHIEDDLRALRAVKSLLKPGGIVIIEVPAGPQLYDAFDKMLMHFRRYDMASLRQKINQAGLQPIRESHLGFFVYPAFAAVKRRIRKMSDSQITSATYMQQAASSAANPIFKAIMAVEGFLGRWISYPVGTRCLVVARN